MFLGNVIGKVVATRKDPSLEGIPLLIVQPIGADRRQTGQPMVAADGETVYCVGAREAPNALPGKYGPVDAAIVGIADRIDM